MGCGGMLGRAEGGFTEEFKAGLRLRGGTEMCSADKEGRSCSQRQEGVQMHPSRAGKDLLWDLKSVQHGSVVK